MALDIIATASKGGAGAAKLDYLDTIHNTAMLLAVGKHSLCVLQGLIAQGANPNLANKAAKVPLHVAIATFPAAGGACACNVRCV